MEAVEGFHVLRFTGLKYKTTRAVVQTTVYAEICSGHIGGHL